MNIVDTQCFIDSMNILFSLRGLFIYENENRTKVLRILCQLFKHAGS